MKYLKHIYLFTLIILLSASCVDTEDYRRFQVDELEISKSDPNFHIYLCFGQSNMEGMLPLRMWIKKELAPVSE